jgi:hypothetical protein
MGIVDHAYDVVCPFQFTVHHVCGLLACAAMDELIEPHI